MLPYGAQKYAPWIGLLAAIAIVYAALACLAQKDLKRLIAFSSVGHMGFVMLGIATLTEIGIQAAIFGMVAHGIITGMLFFCVGSIYDRYHTREIADIGGGHVRADAEARGRLRVRRHRLARPSRASPGSGVRSWRSCRRSARTRRSACPPRSTADS